MHSLHMKCTKLIVIICVIWNLNYYQSIEAQQPALELPVELVGFPVIIVAVRLSNFVKKLAYSLNPGKSPISKYKWKTIRNATLLGTYIRRHRRSIPYEADQMIDMIEAEKKLISELGDGVCIYTRICLQHAEQAQIQQQLENGKRKTKIFGRNEINVDWNDIFRNYGLSNVKQKEFYLLSVFLGDFIASPKFCKLLAKRGRACNDD